MIKEQEKSLEATISRFSSTILRSHFGRGPKSVYINIVHPFICIQIREFLSPMEKILLSKHEGTKVLELRDLLMEEIGEEFKRNFLKEADFEVKELYADWNLANRSGVILAVLEESVIEKEPWPQEVDEKDLLDEIIKVSKMGQKEPGSTEVFWLSERTLLIRRTDIFTLLEKELISMDFEETLKLAKRPLEYKLFKQSRLEEILKRSISEIFVDWSFKADKGYAILTLQKK